MLPPKTALVRKYARAIPALCKVHNTQQFDCAWLSSPTTPSLMAYTCMYMQATCYKHQGTHNTSNHISNSFYAASVCVCARVIVLRPILTVTSSMLCLCVCARVIVLRPILTVTSSMLHPCVHTGERSNHELVVSALQTLQLAALSPFARKAIAGEAQDWSY